MQTEAKLREAMAKAEVGVRALIDKHKATGDQIRKLQQEQDQTLSEIIAGQGLVSGYKLALGEPPIENAVPANLLPSA